MSAHRHMTPGRSSPAALNLGLLFLLFGLSLASLRFGAAPLSLSEVVAGLFGNGPEAQQLIVQQIRLPRVLLAWLVGMALGMSGAALQGLLRNPLAEPGLLGISSSAGLGAVLTLYFGLSARQRLGLASSGDAVRTAGNPLPLWTSARRLLKPDPDPRRCGGLCTGLGIDLIGLEPGP